MLRVIYGRYDEYNGTQIIPIPDRYFDYVYDTKWFEDDYVKRMIKEIDESEVISDNLIINERFGAIPPQYLSGGVKTLILLKFDKTKIFNASSCGDNCAKFILEMAKNEDIIINLRHCMDFGREPFEIELINTGKVVTSMSKFIREVWEVRNSGEV